jgi:hypothetical protein
MHVPALSRIPDSFLPDCFQQFLLLIFLLLAVGEEVLPHLDCLSAPPAVIVVSLPEPLELYCYGCMPALQLVVLRDERLPILHWDWPSARCHSAPVPVQSAHTFLFLFRLSCCSLPGSPPRFIRS